MAPISLTLLVLKTRQVEQLRLFYQTLGVELASMDSIELADGSILLYDDAFLPPDLADR